MEDGLFHLRISAWLKVNCKSAIFKDHAAIYCLAIYRLAIDGLMVK